MENEQKNIIKIGVVKNPPKEFTDTPRVCHVPGCGKDALAMDGEELLWWCEEHYRKHLEHREAHGID